MLLRRLLALLLLPLSHASPLQHPLIQHMYPRWFDICLLHLNLDDTNMSVLIPPSISSDPLTGVVDLPSLRSLLNSAAGSDLLGPPGSSSASSSSMLLNVAAFVEDRASVALFDRLMTRRALRRGGGDAAPAGWPVKLLLTSAECVEDRVGAAGFYEGWMMANPTNFDWMKQKEWEYYFDEMAISAVVVSHQLYAQMQCENKYPRDEWLSALSSQLSIYLTDGAEVLFEVATGTSVPALSCSSHDLPSLRRHFPPDKHFLYSETTALQTASKPIHVSPDGINISAPPPRAVYHSFVHSLPPPPSLPLPPVDGLLVINLSRRPDRWDTFLSRFAALSLSPPPPVTRFPAVDGQHLDLPNDPKVLDLFDLRRWNYGGANGNPYQDHAYRPSVLGCALSHVRAWEDIVNRGEKHRQAYSLNVGAATNGPTSPMYLVVEDDVFFPPGLLHSESFRILSATLRSNSDWDVAFLGLLDDRDVHGDIDLHLLPPSALFQLRRMAPGPRSRGAGLFACIYRPRGAALLLARASARGIQQAVDWFVLDAVASGELVAYRTWPAVATSPEGEGRDSDNDADYPNARLRLLQEKGDEAANTPFAEVSFQSPEEASCVDLSAQPREAEGRALRVTLNFDVEEHANVFGERHKPSRLCFEIRKVMSSRSSPDDLRHSAWFKTEKRTLPMTFDENGTADVGCSGFTEGNLRLVNLLPGDYIISGSHQSRAGERPSSRFSVYFSASDGPCDESETKRCVEVFTYSQTDGRGKEKDHYCKNDGDRPNGLFDFAAKVCVGLAEEVSCMDEIVQRIVASVTM